MSVFVCIRANGVAPSGSYWIGTEAGDPLYRAKLVQRGENKWVAQQQSTVAIPFESLAPFIVELGFSVELSQADYAKWRHNDLPPPSELNNSLEVKEFQAETKELIDEEFERRERERSPPYKETWKKDFQRKEPGQ